MSRVSSLLVASIFVVASAGGCSNEPPKNGEIVEAPAPAKTPVKAPPPNKPVAKFQ